MAALKYTKRSMLNRMLLAVKAKTERGVNAWLVFSLKPKVSEEQYKRSFEMIYDYLSGRIDLWDAGTLFANILGYNVISEDTLGEK